MPEPALPTYAVRRLPSPVVIDGELSAGVLNHLDPVTLVHVTGPAPDPHHLAGQQPVRQPTRLWLGWTDAYLYAAFECEDQDIWAAYQYRDDPIYDEEVVEAFLCPTGDLRDYYEFEVSPRNVVFDARVHSPDLRRGTMRVDTSWNCPGLVTAVRVHGPLHSTPLSDRAHGAEVGASSTVPLWTVEMAIPFAALGEAAAPRQGEPPVWRANFYRIDRANSPEYTAWSPTLESPANFHVPARFGWLDFVD